MNAMKTVRILLLAAAAAAVAFLGGCATPESRIRRNPELFARLSPQQQDLIQHGQIAPGFNAEMVRLALGEPDRYTTRTDHDGASEIWHYVTYDMPDGAPLYRGWYHHYYMWRDPLYPYYLDYPYRRESERFSVIFRNGLVSAIEHEQRRH